MSCQSKEKHNINNINFRYNIARKTFSISPFSFFKRQDQGFSDSIRHVMDGSLPNSLKHIISNAEYYGPSLFLLATDVVTAYVFQVRFTVTFFCLVTSPF